MKPTPARIQTIYLTLTLLNTLAASMIWGINTLFLLDAGLSNTQAFLANAFFTVGQVIFEIPTGIIADLRGRRTSYLLGTITLALSTLLYLGAWQMHASMWLWAIASILLGLGFTFFSGATEAWLVDALEYAEFKGSLDGVFAKAQMIGGGAMLIGAIGGGFIAQSTSLGVPYVIRAGLLLLTAIVAFLFMNDWGWEKSSGVNLVKDIKQLFTTSIELGMKKPSVRYVMLAAPFTSGVGFYVFYALQPYLLELYQDEKAYGIAGLAAAIVAGSQIIGGMLVPYIRKIFDRRTTVLIFSTAITAILLLLIGRTNNFWIAIGLMCLWGLVGAAYTPVRQAYLNGLIPSKQRATVLSFDSLMGSSGGIVIQPALGKVADVWSYSASFTAGAVFQGIALPFLYFAKRTHAASDSMKVSPPEEK